MEQEEIRQLWAEGEDWVIKRQNNQYYHRPDQKYGDWQPGLPPGVFAMDVARIVNTSEIWQFLRLSYHILATLALL